jgi:hypothetical protein
LVDSLLAKGASAMPCAAQGCAAEGGGSSATAQYAGSGGWKNAVKIMMLSVLNLRRQKNWPEAHQYAHRCTQNLQCGCK